MMADVRVIEVEPYMEMQVRLELKLNELPEVPAGRKSIRGVKMWIDGGLVKGLFRITSERLSRNPGYCWVTFRPVE